MAIIQNLEAFVQSYPAGLDSVTDLQLSQNENGRQIRFTIGGVTIPAGSVATISGTKPDGVVYSNTGTIEGADTVIFDEDVQMTAVFGTWYAKIRITNAGNTIASARVRFIIDKDPVDAGAIPSESQLDGLVAEAEEYAEAAEDAAGRAAITYGSPLTASTAAAMTDVNRVYVYTGSESGYTYGNWYYYNGSAWVSGGIYNSAAVETDTTLTESGVPADAKATGDKIAELKDDLAQIEDAVTTTPKHTTVTNNYYMLIDKLEIGKTYKIGITVATSGSYGLNVCTGTSASTIVADLIEITQFEANVPIYVTYTPTVENERYLRLTANNIEWSASISQFIKGAELAEAIEGTSNSYGNNGSVATTYQSSFMNFTVCPCKKATESGQVTELYIKSYSAGTTKVYVGAVDQLYLFVPRQEFDISVLSGEQTIDVSNMNIYINNGEQLLFKFIGQTPFIRGAAGDPEGDNSFYYGVGMQLQVYGAQYAAVFGFGYKVKTTVDTKQDVIIAENSKAIETVNDTMAVVQSNMNIVSDRNGNKYKMIVQNGQIVLLPMNYSHVLCVGNSYTTHPTTTDTESDYRNSIWWGHWAMAASDKQVAWTSLLQNAIRERSENAIVTPVFGRRYETNPTTYNLDNANTFTYWDSTQWKSLKNNLDSFSDVDAVVFFLGANYQGNDWYTLYKAMVDKFYEWFPNATIFCCSCSYSAMSAKDADVQTVAIEKSATYISMIGTGSRSKIGSYVKDDAGTLHQINNSAVANHYGDYGQYLILDRICNGIGYENNTDPLDISLSTISGVTLTLATPKTIEGAVVSVFADVAIGTTLTGLTVTDANSNAVSVTDHGVTDYGRVFTFIMPNTSVTVTAS